jgi:hypothetical protein
MTGVCCAVFKKSSAQKGTDLFSKKGTDLFSDSISGIFGWLAHEVQTNLVA